MKDRTTKLLLGLVAAGLWGLLLRPLFMPTQSHAAGAPDANSPRAGAPVGTTGAPLVFGPGNGTTGTAPFPGGGFPTPVPMPNGGGGSLFVPMSSGTPAMALDATSIYIAQGGRIYCYEKGPSMQIKSWRAIDENTASTAVHLAGH